jgi:two-component system phosphate regulon sensor histidine kinase PhoR
VKKRIHGEFIGIAAAAIIATLLLSVWVFYDLFQYQVLDDLKTYAHVINDTVSEENLDDNSQVYEDADIRFTLIREDGTVIYDSTTDYTAMENHRERPEIREAMEKGSGSAIRRSETLDKSTFYYAMKLDDGNILRVAKEADSIWSILGNAVPVIGVIALLIFGACVVLARVLTKSLLYPIEQMAGNMDKILEIKTYPELMPFITMIHSQHQDIMENAKMRQEFTANVSHELKTPLTSISGYSELIETGMASDEDVRRFAKEIHKNSSRLLTLINDIIRLSELDVEDMDVAYTELNLYQLAEACVDMLQINAEKHDVILRLEGSPCTICANRQMMDELIYNLCDNAIRYNNPGGSVIVKVYKENQETVLSVWDTGIGIPKAHQARIFERFYRVDKSRSKSTGGTGLGLAIVKHIVSQHHARLELESEEGIGTKICVYFPKNTKRA